MTDKRTLFFEDLSPGDILTTEPLTISQSEIIDFASEWDPQPFHIDPEAAKFSVYGGLTASSLHIQCISAKLYQSLPIKVSYIGVVHMETRIPNPLRPDVPVHLEREVIEARPSKSRPEAGIVKQSSRVIDQHGTLVMEMTSTNLINKRPKQGLS